MFSLMAPPLAVSSLYALRLQDGPSPSGLLLRGAAYFYGAAASTAVPPGTPFHLGETDDSSLQSELLGICWHSHGSSSMAPLLVCLVICALTCQAAGTVPSVRRLPATIAASDGCLSLSHHAALLRQCMQQRLPLIGDYVPGHAGHLGNELSDSFAKHARYHITPPCRTGPAALACASS